MRKIDFPISQSSLWIILFLLVLSSGWLVANDEKTEPPRLFTLVIDGREVMLELDREITLDQTLSHPRIMLRAGVTRHFDQGGIAFDYPATFGWEADVQDNDYKCWTLSGNDFKIMVFDTVSELNAEMQTRSMLKLYSTGKEQPREITHTFKGRIYTGKRVPLSSKSIAFYQEALDIPVKKRHCLLVFQDFPPDNKAFSAESEMVLKLLRETFTVK